MAHNDTEIEIKIPLDKDEFFKVKENLEKIARFVKRAEHSDTYFTPKHRNFLEPKFPFEWLSIRKRGNKKILNYKHWYTENNEDFTHCDEFETEINNDRQMEKIFSVLNIRKLVTVDKEREVYIYNDELEIALDNVKDLGYFIEIEAVKNLGNVEETRKKLLMFAESLGIDVSKEQRKGGYAFLMMKKKGLIKD